MTKKIHVTSVIRQQGESPCAYLGESAYARACAYQRTRNVCFSENLAPFVFL